MAFLKSNNLLLAFWLEAIGPKSENSLHVLGTNVFSEVGKRIYSKFLDKDLFFEYPCRDSIEIFLILFQF